MKFVIANMLLTNVQSQAVQQLSVFHLFDAFFVIFSNKTHKLFFQLKSNHFNKTFFKTLDNFFFSSQTVCIRISRIKLLIKLAKIYFKIVCKLYI